jgi:hypothetical protein
MALLLRGPVRPRSQVFIMKPMLLERPEAERGEVKTKNAAEIVPARRDVSVLGTP